jgi:anti-sigma factor RsiW
MSCPWREKVALYVDGELDPAAQQEFSAHLSACPECPPAVTEQMELKKAMRVAGRSFAAPPELHAAVYRSIHPHRSVSPWWKWALAPLSVLLLALIAFLVFPRREADPMTAGLVDTHITTLASEHPVDVISDDRHTVKPWFQGKLPFTFNLPEVADSHFKLVGGRVAYVGQTPGAELLYTAGPHKISIFIFQARDKGTKAPSWNHDLSFTVSSWTAGGRQCYLVTDASKDEAGKLVTMFQEANRS